MGAENTYPVDLLLERKVMMWATVAWRGGSHANELPHSVIAGPGEAQMCLAQFSPFGRDAFIMQGPHKEPCNLVFLNWNENLWVATSAILPIKDPQPICPSRQGTVKGKNLLYSDAYETTHTEKRYAFLLLSDSLIYLFCLECPSHI